MLLQERVSQLSLISFHVVPLNSTTLLFTEDAGHTTSQPTVGVKYAHCSLRYLVAEPAAVNTTPFTVLFVNTCVHVVVTIGTQLAFTVPVQSVTRSNHILVVEPASISALLPVHTGENVKLLPVTVSDIYPATKPPVAKNEAIPSADAANSCHEVDTNAHVDITFPAPFGTRLILMSAEAPRAPIVKSHVHHSSNILSLLGAHSSIAHGTLSWSVTQKSNSKPEVPHKAPQLLYCTCLLEPHIAGVAHVAPVAHVAQVPPVAPVFQVAPVAPVQPVAHVGQVLQVHQVAPVGQGTVEAAHVAHVAPVGHVGPVLHVEPVAHVLQALPVFQVAHTGHVPQVAHVIDCHVAPVAHVAHIGHAIHVGHNGQVGQVLPWKPVVPCGPVAQVQPVAPVGPVGPVLQVHQVAQVNPVGH